MVQAFQSNLEVVVPMVSGDRRRSRRFDLQLPLQYTVLGAKPSTGPYESRTINISSSGALFAVDQALDVRSRLRLLIQWPCQRRPGGRTALHVESYVVRCEDGRVAVAFTRRTLRMAPKRHRSGTS